MEMEYHDQELRKYATALGEANKKLNLLGSITRHDIVNKLTVMMGYLKRVKNSITDPVLLEYIARQEEAAIAIRDHLEFSGLYQTIGLQSPEWQDVAHCINEAEKTLHLPDGIRLTLSIQSLSVYADPLLVKVFYNLLDNAVRHGDHVSEIHISGRTCPDGYCLDIEDNGTGVPDDLKEKIFERGVGKNTGFGLFLVREILAISGISIYETGESGRGARFEMKIPQGNFQAATAMNGKEITS
jgi:signal transduction histidine kinase